MSILKEVKEYWGWTGIEPQELVTENQFGNLIIKDADDKFWRVCPEDVYCEVVAESITDYNKLIQNEEFLEDWYMTNMVTEAHKALGALAEGHKYYMVIPGVLDGEYGGKNVKTASHVEIIRFSGALGKKIRDMPDGTKIQLKPILDMVKAMEAKK